MSSFTIKIIAVITMLIDHVKDGLFPKVHVMNIIGRIAFPLFAFQAAIGYEKTKNVNKYMMRMLIFAIISEAPYYLFIKKFAGGRLWFDVIFTLLFGIIAIHIWNYKIYKEEYEKENVNKEKMEADKTIRNINIFFSWIIKIFLIMTLCLIAELLKFDYGGLGVLFVLLIHLLFRDKRKWLFAIVYLIYCILEFKDSLGNSNVIPYIVFMYLPIVFMFLYNGKKGPSMKYFFYFFYPIHLTIILLISNFISA